MLLAVLTEGQHSAGGEAPALGAWTSNATSSHSPLPQCSLNRASDLSAVALPPHFYSLHLLFSHHKSESSHTHSNVYFPAKIILSVHSKTSRDGELISSAPTLNHHVRLQLALASINLSAINSHYTFLHWYQPAPC